MASALRPNRGFSARFAKTCFQIVPIAPRLFDAESLDGIVGDPGEVGLGPRREAIVSHVARGNAARPRPKPPSRSCR